MTTNLDPPITKITVCNGICYFKNLNKTDYYYKCFGERIEINSNLNSSEIPENSQFSSDTLHRSIGSTALFSNGPSRKLYGVSPFTTTAVEVGPIEAAGVRTVDRIGQNGVYATLIRPGEIVASRAIRILQENLKILKNSIFPISNFIIKIEERIPKIFDKILENIEILKNIKIEIEK